ncbi:DUF3883 domain-containing protein [Solimonas terrae]|uniref:DUF3883 domain-containing protein n=1 Tax=Solimonas terrae TaxID=1396819 RepID=A0A6M2BRX1_9GAMM|nr:DUF3883 domain-containing protein [Solimonas terrae]NGY04961.1 DUF3883 domain-containing protein [Solimonas terrae]
MSVARESDGLLDAEQVHALLNLIGGSSSQPTPDRLAHEMRVANSASIARTLNTLRMLGRFNALQIVDGEARLRVGQGWPASRWRAEIGRMTAIEIGARLATRGPAGCLQSGANGNGLWLDSLSLPGSHDGVSLWVAEFGVAARERATSRLWRVADNFESIFLDAAREANVQHSRRRVSTKQLEARRARDLENGLLAEEWVLARERERLHGHPLLDQVRRISDEDVSAGFDILSFASLSSLRHDLHIEVKSYSGERRFFWSRNELEVAEELGEQYSLHLVDRDLMATEGYTALAIRGPHSAFFLTGLPGWQISADGYEIRG